MLMDEKMDHGPILAQKKVTVPAWPPRGSELDELLAREGARLLATILPEWLSGGIEAREQNHELATYCGHITKEDALLDLGDEAYRNLLKIRAYDGWPVAYFYADKNGTRIRVQVLDAHIEHDTLVLDTVKPEGKKAMPYADFLKGLQS
jgi:methionyl-tRNA formyltransferase